MPDKNRIGALSAMRSTRREAKDTREVERATRNETETLRTGSRASNARRNGYGTDKKRASSARRNGNGTCRKASEKRATQRNGTVGKKGREMRTERTMLADHSKNSTKQPSRNSRTNLSLTLGRRRETIARQSNIVRYGAITNKFNKKLIYGNAVVH